MAQSISTDRIPRCVFTFADGRRCRTPRSDSHPHFCFFHARKEAQARAAQEIGDDLSFFFSGAFLSACDLATAIGRLMTAVADGQLKPKTASTLAYLAQTLLQTIHLAQNEYSNAYSPNAWRASIRRSVESNYHHRFPPAAPSPVPEPHPTPVPTPPPAPLSPQAPAAAVSPAAHPTVSSAPHPTVQSVAHPESPVAHPFRDQASPPNEVYRPPSPPTTTPAATSNVPPPPSP